MPENEERSIIETFRDIEETGDLPPGFYWSSIKWDSKYGWTGYIAGSVSGSRWMKVKKLPEEALRMLV